MLRLHAHQHTDDTPQTVLTAKAGGKAVLSTQHQHCHIDSFYGAPFQPSEAMVLTAPLRLPTYAQYRSQAPVRRASHLLDGACLRGPPVARA